MAGELIGMHSHNTGGIGKPPVSSVKTHPVHNVDMLVGCCWNHNATRAHTERIYRMLTVSFRCQPVFGGFYTRKAGNAPLCAVDIGLKVFGPASERKAFGTKLNAHRDQHTVGFIGRMPWCNNKIICSYRVIFRNCFLNLSVCDR